MPEVTFSTSTSIILLSAALVGGVALSRFSYRATNPPIAPRRKQLLVALRSLGLFSLFLLIGDPLVSLLYRSEQPPVIAVLIDDSRSMTIADKTGKRSDNLFGVLASTPLQELSREGEVRFVAFGEHARDVASIGSDSLRFSSDQTDITEALRYAKGLSSSSNVRGILLLSDGNITAGGNPVFDEERLSIPVFSVILGDTADQTDILVRKVVTNAVVYKGTRVPVHVQIKSSGAQRERVEVSLRRESEILDRKSIILEPGVHEVPVSLMYVPSETGSQRYTVTVSPLPNELTERNNRFSFSVKVLENKMKVLILGGAPSPDIAFIRRSLDADSTVEMTAIIERGDGTYYGPTPSASLLESQECLILAGFPTSSSSPDLVNLVLEAGSKGTGILFLSSRAIDHTRLSSLLPILPFTIRDPSQVEQEAFLHPRPRSNDLLLKLPEHSSRDAWSQLPPLFTLQASLRAKPESDVHAVKRFRTILTEEPFLISRNVNRRKSVALLGYGVWQWKMLSDPALEGLLDHWLNTAVRWLTTREEDRRIRITPAKETFTADEPVEFSGQIYDETMRPVDDAQITLTVKNRAQRDDLTMTSLGNGQYDAQSRPLPEGEYAFEGTVRRDGAETGRVAGSFSVGESNAEFLETRANALLLRQLSARSGGRFYSPDNLQSLASDIRSLPGFQSTEIMRSADLPLWTNPWVLVSVVLLFSLEWLLRKQSGML
jgi:hypothetical protein